MNWYAISSLDMRLKAVFKATLPLFHDGVMFHAVGQVVSTLWTTMAYRHGGLR